MCGRLNLSMCGTRDAAQNWFDAYSQQFVEVGFQQVVTSPCTFCHPKRAIITYVQGDDYVSTGQPPQLRWLKEQLEKRYQVKTQTSGINQDQLQQVMILNRVVAWNKRKGIGYEADPRHVEIINQQLVFEHAKLVATLSTREEGRTTSDAEDPSDEEQDTKYRALVARCNHLSPDRPDIASAAKELARNMSSPRRGDWIRLKRLGRYLVGKPRFQQWFGYQSMPKRVNTYTDADWAGCRETRKSTTGGVIMIGSHSIKSWSKTQALIALSSGGVRSLRYMESFRRNIGHCVNAQWLRRRRDGGSVRRRPSCFGENP